jgi:hypothetical protein
MTEKRETMRICLEVDLKNGEPVQTVYTDMYVITEWEDVYNRKTNDGQGLGFVDMCSWAFILLEVPMAFTKLNVKKWIKANKTHDDCKC